MVVIRKKNVSIATAFAGSCGYVPAPFLQYVCDGLQGEGTGRLGVGAGVREEGGEGEVRGYHLA